jgi:putative ABC transport system substrate-binding protein
MKRREFLGVLGGAAATWPVGARARQAGRVYRIGSLHQSPAGAPHHVAFYDELRALGFIDGQNLTIDRQGYGLQVEQLADHAAALTKSSIDVILCGGDVAIRTARKVTDAIPIIAVTDDMVGAGFVRSLAKPGGNITGISILATELNGKRQEILIEAVPGLRRMASLADTSTTSPAQAEALRKQASTLAVELSIHWTTRIEDIASAVDAAYQANAEALNVLATPLLFNNRRIIMDRAEALRLPAMYQWPETAEEGGFVAYGPRFTQVYRQVARLIAKVFAGTEPASIPVEQPTRFELVVNLKTAKAIGHEIPAGLVLRSDKVIDE